MCKRIFPFDHTDTEFSDRVLEREAEESPRGPGVLVLVPLIARVGPTFLSNLLRHAVSYVGGREGRIPR